MGEADSAQWLIPKRLRSVNLYVRSLRSSLSRCLPFLPDLCNEHPSQTPNDDNQFPQQKQPKSHISQVLHWKRLTTSLLRRRCVGLIHVPRRIAMLMLFVDPKLVRSSFYIWRKFGTCKDVANNSKLITIHQSRRQSETTFVMIEHYVIFSPICSYLLQTTGFAS